MAQTVKNLPAMQKTRVWSLGWDDSLEEGLATHSSVLAWRIPWTEKPGGLQSTGSQSWPWLKQLSMHACNHWGLVLKDDAVKVLHSMCQQIWKTQQWPPDWKRSVFIPISKKGNAKECSNYCSNALISHASKVMLKILLVRLWHYMSQELPDVQAGFRKGRGTRDQIANICWITEKVREFQKNIYFCFIDYAKVNKVCVDHNKLENSERDGNTRPPDLPPEKSVCRSGSNS